jgi:hypothetical protein
LKAKGCVGNRGEFTVLSRRKDGKTFYIKNLSLTEYKMLSSIVTQAFFNLIKTIYVVSQFISDLWAG